MKKIVGLILVLVFLSAEAFAQYGPVRASTLTVRKTASFTGVATFTATPVFLSGISATGYFVSELSNGTTRFTVGTTGGTGAGRTYVDSLYAGKVFATGFKSDLSNGTYRFTAGTTAGTGSGNFIADTATLGTVTVATAKTLIHTGSFYSDKSNGTPRVTVGSAAGTAAGNFLADTATLGTVTVNTAKKLIHTGSFYSDKSNGTPRVTVGSAAGTAGGNFIADTINVGVTTAKIVNIGFGMTTSVELHPLTVGGTLAAGANRFTVDTLGNVVGVAATFTGSITATSQTIASGAVTASGTSTFDKAQIGSAAAGRALIDSIQIYGTDSMAIWSASTRFIFGKTVYK